jgi:hypothetical protein
MTLSLAIFDPTKGTYGGYIDRPELNGRHAAGFEDYRTVLWGSLAMRRRAYRFFPVLRNADLFVILLEMDAFKIECKDVWKNARVIASEIWPIGIIDKWWPIRRFARIRSQRAYGARSIRQYIDRIQYAIALAESLGMGVSIS